MEDWALVGATILLTSLVWYGVRRKTRTDFRAANTRLVQEARAAQLRAEEHAVEAEQHAARLEIANQELAEAVHAAEEARAAVAAAEAEQRAVIEAMRDVVLVLDADGRYVKIPATAPDLLYAPSQDLVGKRMHDVMPAAAADHFLSVIRRALETRDAVRLEYSLPIQDRIIWFSAVVSPMASDRVVWVSRDVTAHRASEEALRASEEHYRLLFDSNPLPMWVYDRQSLHFLAVNPAAVHHYGYSREEFLAMTVADIRPPEDVAELRRAVANAPRDLHVMEGWRHRRSDGSIIDVEIAAHPMTFDGHEAELVVAHDVTLERRAEAQLRETSAVLRGVIDDSPVALVSVNLELQVTRWNPAAERLLGWTAAEMIGQSHLRIVPEARLEEHRDLRRRVLSGGSPVMSIETQGRRKDGSLVDVSASLNALRDVHGDIIGFMLVLVDITEHRRLENQLRQAQKMEAVGQLAGGIAHDFNNLLTAITSYGQLLLKDLAADDPRLEYVREIERAADRAAVLTRQLLAFSRQQVVRPQVLSINAVVSELQPMLRRLVREDIDIRLGLDPALGNVEIDRGQLEQILVNLIVNARDAMREGGTITIETANVELAYAHTLARGDTTIIPGVHVMLAVSDTGVGMTPEIQAHIFEPFFTTKETGKGTGLGLATVYGIIKQARGHVWVYSEPESGTTFKIYLPRTGAELTPHVPPSAEVATAAHGAEIILLVEDDEAVRGVAHRVLARQGYTVIEAKNGAHAVSILEQDTHVDLVLTDMVMPEMSGSQVALHARALRPGLRVLFMSGYSKDAAQQFTELGDDTGYLEKPFSPDSLARRVRELLDR